MSRSTDALEALINLATFCVLLFVGWFVGRRRERKHFEDIARRESASQKLVVHALRTLPEGREVADARLVTGSVVVSIDYFKRVASTLRSFFGGEVRSLSPLLERARREAVLRMKESAPTADLIINTRLESASISTSARKNSIGSVEVVASGTAIRFKDRDPTSN